MPYADPEKRREAAKLAARRRREDPQYKAKVQEYQRGYYADVISKDPDQIAKARARSAKWYKEHTLTPEGLAAVNSSRKKNVRAYYLRKAEAKATRPCPDLCEACGNSDPTGRRLAWDHDHKTGKFRGWLCGSCNNALGRIGDDPALARKLADYLEQK